MARTRKSVRKPTLNLLLKDFPADLAQRLEAMAKDQRPSSDRNSFIQYLLEEFEAGRLAPVKTQQGEAA